VCRCVVGLRVGERDVADDSVVEFSDPSVELVRAGQPCGRVVDSFDGVAVAAVDLDERVGGVGQVGRASRANADMSAVRVGHRDPCLGGYSTGTS
jgi:hypothetical protein